MARNHTTSKLEVTSTGTSVLSGIMYITPKEGYVVSYSDFTITGPSNIGWNTNLEDTTTSGAIGNKVKVTVTVSSYTANANADIVMSVSNSAKLFEARINQSIKISTLATFINTGEQATPVSPDGITMTISNLMTGLSHNVETGVISGYVNYIGAGNLPLFDVSTTIGNMEDKSGNAITGTLSNIGSRLTKHRGGKPYLAELNSTVNLSDVTKYDNGEPISYSETVYLKPSEVSEGEDIGDYVLSTGSEFSESKSIMKSIDSIDVGSSIVNINGEVRDFKIYGSVGASFNLHVVSGSTSLANLSNNTITSLQASVRGKGFITLSVTIPSQVSSTVIECYLSANGGSYISLGLPIVSDTTELNQYTNPTYTLAASSTDSSREWTLPVPTIYTGRPNVSSVSVSHLKGISSVISLFYKLVNTSTDMVAPIRQPLTADWVVSGTGTTPLIFTNMSAQIGKTSKEMYVRATISIPNWGVGDRTFTLNMDNLIA